ncbi:MAG: hypothetical protein N3G19_02435 [Candidatus Pacearchaeota archaeon]|nr:hypothetical protein [Candidatus Pacearchaeota archaeon]
MKKINLDSIIKNENFLSTFREAYQLNKPDVETGFLVQIKNKDLDIIKINKPTVKPKTIIDLDEIHKSSYCCLPYGKRG